MLRSIYNPVTGTVAVRSELWAIEVASRNLSIDRTWTPRLQQMNCALRVFLRCMVFVVLLLSEPKRIYVKATVKKFVWNVQSRYFTISVYGKGVVKPLIIDHNYRLFRKSNIIVNIHISEVILDKKVFLNICRKMNCFTDVCTLGDFFRWKLRGFWKLARNIRKK